MFSTINLRKGSNPAVPSSSHVNFLVTLVLAQEPKHSCSSPSSHAFESQTTASSNILFGALGMCPRQWELGHHDLTEGRPEKGLRSLNKLDTQKRH